MSTLRKSPTWPENDTFFSRSGNSPPSDTRSMSTDIQVLDGNIRIHLAALLADVDEGQVISVPVRWLRALLGAEMTEHGEVDLTVEEVAKMFGRHPNTIRGWLQNGGLRGYKLKGKEWRVPRTAIREFQTRQADPTTAESTALDTADLSAWRGHRKL